MIFLPFYITQLIEFAAKSVTKTWWTSDLQDPNAKIEEKDAVRKVRITSNNDSSLKLWVSSAPY
jgi:hypothetical protein